MTTPKRSQLEQRLTDWWYTNRSVGLWWPLLWTLSKLFALLRVLSRQSTKVLRAKQHTTPPVLVVGNLIAGGAGKTPLVMAVCKALTDKGYRVGLLSRGYGRATHTVEVLDPKVSHSAKQVGDEPAWLIQQTQCPMAVGANRLQAFQTLIGRHPDLDLVVSDDGLQHWALPRTLEWAVFDNRLAGNCKLLPLGPLREPLSRLATVDAVVASNMPARALESLMPPNSDNVPRVELILQVKGLRHLATQTLINVTQAQTAFAGKSMRALTGLGNPAKFFNLLKDLNLGPFEQLALPDHFDYPEQFCASFGEEVLLTTGKDAVKLNQSDPRLWVVEINMDLPKPLMEQLEKRIGRQLD